MSHNDAIETFEHNGLTVRIHYDSDPINPRKDYENLATLVCWHRRSNLGDANIEGGTTAKELLRSLRAKGEKVLALMPLYLYEHGGMTMSTGSFSCRFDSGQVGWGYVTKASAEKMGCIGPTYDKAFFEKAIEGDVETYDHYLTGQCYGYTVEDADGEEVESCWGFLGDMDYVRSEAKSAAEHADNPARDRMVEELAGRATFAGV